jgi:cell division protease FtsH
VHRAIKAVVFWLVIGVSALLLGRFVKASPADQQSPFISYSQFMSDVEAGSISTVKISGTLIQGEYRDGKGHFRVNGPSNQGLFLDDLRRKGVEIWFADATQGAVGLQLLGTWAPLILLGALWFFMIRQMSRKGSISRGGGSQPPSNWGQQPPSTPVT